MSGDRPPRVLIVDDDAQFRGFIVELLQLEGCVVRDAENGLQARSLLQSESFDVVVTDLFMPEMDGIELLRWIREAHPALPVIACSAGWRSIFQVPLEMARSLGAHAVLTKPFPATALLRSLRALLPGLSSLCREEERDGTP